MSWCSSTSPPTFAAGSLFLTEEDELCLCAVTRLELLYSVRSGSDYQALEEDLAQFRDLRIDAETFGVALSAHRELAARGQHRVPHSGCAYRLLRPTALR